eukprot:2206681-Pyramimonas_sp.AAC.1
MHARCGYSVDAQRLALVLWQNSFSRVSCEARLTVLTAFVRIEIIGRAAICGPMRQEGFVGTAVSSTTYLSQVSLLIAGHSRGRAVVCGHLGGRRAQGFPRGSLEQFRFFLELDIPRFHDVRS